jgi:flagellar biosynthesis GTPase FlhF
MGPVFVSYTHEDAGRVKLLVKSLQEEGFEVWWDREIPIGVPFHEYIREQLEKASAALVLWSRAALGSNFLQWEAHEAHSRHRMVPVRLEDIGLPPEYFGMQTGDLWAWQGSRTDPEWLKVVDALWWRGGDEEEKKRWREEKRKRQQEEAERKRQQEEAERRRQQEEAERKRQQEEAERKRQQEEAERKRQQEEGGLGDETAEPPPPPPPPPPPVDLGCQCSLCRAARELDWDWEPWAVV